MKLIIPVQIFSFACVCFVNTAQASNPVETTRNTTKEWIAVEKSIVSESAAWLEKQTLFQDLIQATEAEINTLEASLAEIKSTQISADTTRKALLMEQDSLRTRDETIATFLDEIEAKLKNLRHYLPQPLAVKLSPTYQHLPKDPKKTSQDLAERMQAVISLLTEIQQFDRTITVSDEIQTFADGTQGEVRSVYIGLGVAYYRTPSGDDAGMGHPDKNGWVWESRPSLAKEIEKLIAIADQSTSEARFIALPVTLQN